MCGVTGGIGVTDAQLDAAVTAIAHRGPDAHGKWSHGDIRIGHVRLSIIAPDDRGADQPMERGHIVLSYNGELWNYRALRAELRAAGREFTTKCDTEVVAHALGEWGDAALLRFQGMYALAWWDGGALKIARDRFGEIPLHFARTPAGGWAFASELRALCAYGVRHTTAVDVGPGEMVQLYPTPARTTYYDPPAAAVDMDRDTAATALRAALVNSVAERTMADVPVCCLLSGGIDSATVAAMLAPVFPDLVAYTAVYDEKSRDLRCARQTAEMLGIELIEVNVPTPTADDLAGVIDIIEMPFKAQIEIGWACTYLADAMAGDGFKVTYSGEGSDELWASYGFAYHGLKTAGWHPYRKNLFMTQARKNFARCNKVFMRSSVECRLPFLNTALVELALSMPASAVQSGKSRPKAVLQDAVRDLMPADVVDRPKVAFQDGMGLKDACATAVANPRKFYTATYAQLFRGDHG